MFQSSVVSPLAQSQQRKPAAAFMFPLTLCPFIRGQHLLSFSVPIKDYSAFTAQSYPVMFSSQRYLYCTGKHHLLLLLSLCSCPRPHTSACSLSLPHLFVASENRATGQKLEWQKQQWGLFHFLFLLITAETNRLCGLFLAAPHFLSLRLSFFLSIKYCPHHGKAYPSSVARHCVCSLTTV